MLLFRANLHTYQRTCVYLHPVLGFQHVLFAMQTQMLQLINKLRRTANQMGGGKLSELRMKFFAAWPGNSRANMYTVHPYSMRVVLLAGQPSVVGFVRTDAPDPWQAAPCKEQEA